ncbi:MAG TPA: sigma-70 family RNA polymerase sigma factor [Thermoanaerobaculia bacterium]|nr:sigma-70 family RNA polymerase sigma factor [Thermoanaerobaculia bacterium]
MDAKELFLQSSEAIERIATYVSRKGHLDATETEDFVSYVNVELIDNNYEVIRKFEGRSTFTTYLNTVIQHLFYQYRVKMWGKWRPSAEAKRIGHKAITLERLLTRDGYSLDEAVQVLTTGAAAGFTVPEIEAIYLRLPIRMPRPVLVSQASPPDTAAAAVDTDDRLMSRDRQEAGRAAARVIDAAIKDFPLEDQLLLQLRFWHAWKVPHIAEHMRIPPKKAYKRIDKLLSVLRGKLERAGVGRHLIAEVLAHGDHEIHVEQLHQQEGKSPACPSDRIDGGRSGGASRLSG